MNSLDKRVQEAIKAKTKKGGDWNKLLEQEANRLYALISAEIGAYYLSYEPKVYQWTGSLQKSVRIRTSGDRFEIYFEPSLAYHPSIMPTKYPKAFVPTLIDYGWDWGKTPHINHFTYYEGYHFIEKAVEKFKETTSLPVTISIESKYHPEYYATLG